MEKAYDLKELVKILKDNGLDVAEEAAKVLVESVFKFVEESADLSENKYDDLLKVLLPQLKKHLLEQVDKIDKKEG